MISLTPVACLASQEDQGGIPLILLSKSSYGAYCDTQPEAVLGWLNLQKFKPEPGKSALVADEAGKLTQVLVGMAEEHDPWALACLIGKIPDGYQYSIDPTHYTGIEETSDRLVSLAYGWGMACYRFKPFKKAEGQLPVLQLPQAAREEAQALLESAYLARDLINLPTNHLGPQELLSHAQAVAEAYGAQVHRIDGEALLTENYPAIHAVGRASASAPGLIDIRWGDPSHKKVTLVGKGVCFDTGGLDIKPSQFMKLMKKDMGGAAVLLGLARLIMARQLPVRLRLLIPAVENSVSANAFRPQDVLATRKGLTVEIGNTDAEGRLILCDALAEADQETPDLLIDCATLTGAARVALGTEIPAFFTPSDALARQLEEASRREQDLTWRLPLHLPYEEMLDSKVADINNAPDSTYAGAIAAALFLRRFVEKTPNWLHIDMMAWNAKPRPGRPVGGEPQCLRTLYRLIQDAVAA